MVKVENGIRVYTTSEKTKRPSKVAIDQEKIEKRNGQQRKLYITLDNIDEIFSQNNDKFPVCHDFIFNLIQGKVTKYFNVRSYDRKKEVAYDCLNRLYSILKRKLLKQQETIERPCVMFYLSQFYRYIDLLVYSTVFFETQDYKYTVQEPDDFKTDEVLLDNQQDNKQYDDEDFDKYIKNVDDDLEDNSEKIKLCIESNNLLEPKEKNVLLKLYKKAYTPISNFSLTKKEAEILTALQFRYEYEPELLKDLEAILNDSRDIGED